MATDLGVTRLRCEYLVNPLGLDVARPRLSWELTARRRGQRQTAYRVLVASDPATLAEDRGDLWDSGRVASDQSAHVVYDGPALASGQRAWWKVRAWDRDGVPADWSEPAWWEAGLLRPEDWAGQWIGLPLQDTPPDEAAPDGLDGLVPSPYLRRVVRLPGAPRRARLYATARGVYELRLNGERVGDAVLAPGWTDYDRRIQYQIYDVTDLLRPGDNALGAILGPGWYAGHVGFGHRCRHYGARPQLLLQLHVELDGGATLVVASDGAWRGATGPIRYSDLLMGEHYDARRDLPGWDEPGFDAADWRPVDAQPRDAVPLVAERAEPVRVTEESPARAVTAPAPGVAIADLGQNITGWVRLRVRGEAGTRVQLRFGEVLNPDGTLYTANLRAARATDTYVLRGGGDEIWEPRFTFHGFRYVEVTGYPGALAPDALTGRVVGSDTPLAGAFSCSSELVNQLQRNIDWGQRGNFLSIPTDCPQRDERLGWLGDAQVFVRTACCNRDVAAFFTKWLDDVADAQSAAGAYPDVAPRLVDAADGAPAWADAGVIVPWTLWQHYGDTRIIERHWGAMTRWLDYLRRANPDLLWEARRNHDFGDWLSVEADTPKDVIATAYFAHDARLMAQMARAIGRDAEAADYADLAARIAAAFNAAYVTADGRVKGETQTAYALALHFGLLPPNLRPLAAGHLVADIERRGRRLSTGFVGVGYLCPTLTAAGHLDVAYRLLLNEEFPSWGYSIRHGATTIWERWDGWTAERGFQDPGMNSFNHYALGAVGAWLYRAVAGIDTDPERPGYRHIVFHPRPGGGLTYARAELRSPYGPITSHWTIAGDTFTL
ncbi:MAG TPA: family 78 glycoside hydrolase catalytic domain, partial [Thermomicrobiales bacterium]|nr:family 78 glycoside hydrolase catalytic domain [Thermomicrobiales bacterium]